MAIRSSALRHGPRAGRRARLQDADRPSAPLDVGARARQGHEAAEAAPLDIPADGLALINPLRGWRIARLAEDEVGRSTVPASHQEGGTTSPHRRGRATAIRPRPGRRRGRRCPARVGWPPSAPGSSATGSSATTTARPRPRLPAIDFLCSPGPGGSRGPLDRWLPLRDSSIVVELSALLVVQGVNSCATRSCEPPQTSWRGTEKTPTWTRSQPRSASAETSYGATSHPCLPSKARSSMTLPYGADRAMTLWPFLGPGDGGRAARCRR